MLNSSKCISLTVSIDNIQHKKMFITTSLKDKCTHNLVHDIIYYDPFHYNILKDMNA